MPGESDSDTRVSGTQSLLTKGLIQVSFPVSYNKVLDVLDDQIFYKEKTVNINKTKTMSHFILQGKCTQFLKDSCFCNAH